MAYYLNLHIESESIQTLITVLKGLTETEQKHWMVWAVDRLDKNEKTVISFYYFEEMTHAEIADAMQWPEHTVVHVHTKAIQNLIKFAKQDGL